MSKEIKEKIVKAWGILYKNKYLQFSTIRLTKKEMKDEYGNGDFARLEVIIYPPKPKK